MEFKHKRQLRLPDWDYSQPGDYFVTICTFRTAPFFGKVIDSEMSLSDAGHVAQRMWIGIPQQFDSVEIDEFIVMPNHVHGIIRILERGRRLIYQMHTASNESARDNKRLMNQTPTGMSAGIRNNPMHSERPSLGRIVRWFKGRTTFEVRRMGIHSFRWQRRFYDI